jgi:hypothetical protein
MNLTPAEVLRGLHMTGILTTPARPEDATTVLCDMDVCYCPQGRGYFEPIAVPLTDWSPAEDLFPRLKKDGGRRVAGNIRLAHRLCNRLDYAKNAGFSKARGRAAAKQILWHQEHTGASLAHAGNRAAAENQWAANRASRSRQSNGNFLSGDEEAFKPVIGPSEHPNRFIRGVGSFTRNSAGAVAEAADDAWEATTEAFGGMRHFTGDIADAIGERAGDSRHFVRDSSAEYGPRAWDWTMEAASFAWARSKMVGRHSSEFVSAHDEEILAALRMLAVAASNVALFAAEHDTAILAAAGVIAVNQPYLLAVIAAYEVSKPLIHEVARIINEMAEDGKPEPIKKKDWNGLASLLSKLETKAMAS